MKSGVWGCGDMMGAINAHTRASELNPENSIISEVGATEDSASDTRGAASFCASLTS